MASRVSVDARDNTREAPAEFIAWLVRLRWVALAGVATVIAASEWIFGQLPPGSSLRLWAVAGALFTYNLALSLGRGNGRSGFRHPASQIVVDCTALAMLVHFSGGVENPFLPLFVLHVVNANIALRPRAATAILVFAVVLVAGIVLGEGTGLLNHYCLKGDDTACSSNTITVQSVGVLSGLVLTLTAASGFARFLTNRLHESRLRLAENYEVLSREKELLGESQQQTEIERVRLHAIVNGMADAVLFTDRHGSVQLSNQRARDILRNIAGGPKEDVLSKESLARRFEALEEQPHARTEPVIEVGEQLFEPTFSTVRTPRGEVIGLVAVMRDVNARAALDKRLMHEERMSVVGKLAASVAHEINNPIGVVSLYSQHALAKLDPDSPVYKNLEMIKRNADSCRKITEQLLELARPRKPTRQRIDLRALCSEVLDSVRPLADKGGVILEGDARAQKVPIWTRCDPEQIRQALLNLALNAVEATPSGGKVQITAYEAQDGRATAHVVEVSDDGPGIPPAHLERVFQPFFTTKDSGTGLGLSVADNIVKSHAGRMSVGSASGGGTTFRILLPASQDTDTPSETADDEA